MSSKDQVSVDLSAWARKWRGRREGLVMQAAIMEIERLRTTLSGISTCSTCDVCRKAASKALGTEQAGAGT